MSDTAIVWYRNDLRLHDHPALTAALENHKKVIPVYCLDDHFLGTTPYRFPKTGAFRMSFLLESLECLQQSIHEKGGTFIIKTGQTAKVIRELINRYHATAIYCQQEDTPEEMAIQNEVAQSGLPVYAYPSFTLLHTDDLPFDLSSLPEVFTNFRKKVEKFSSIRPPLPASEIIPVPDNLPVTGVPTLDELGYPETKYVRAPFKGGEKEGLQRLHYYLWESDLAKTYKNTRNQLLGTDYSSKFSLWLAMGCLSPRLVYSEIKKYEVQRTKNISTYWLIFELLWRDFFRLMAMKREGGFFHYPMNKQMAPADPEKISMWIEGRTGDPFVDANMLEIRHTGYMSNRGRQNVASYLWHDLGQPWQAGAEYFESMLVDYDVCSNYGNWSYITGPGNDPRKGRKFNTRFQAKKYDRKGNYIRHWLPELSSTNIDSLFSEHLKNTSW